jgi:hypothetical protein
MTFTPGRFSGTASALVSFRADGATALDSDFLVVTGTFKCADNGLADALADSVGAAGVFGSVFAALTAAATVDARALDGFPTVGFAVADPDFSDDFDPASVFAPGLPAALTAADFVASCTGVGRDAGNAAVIGGFFISFAMASTIDSVCAAESCPEAAEILCNVLNQKLLSIAQQRKHPALKRPALR